MIFVVLRNEWIQKTKQFSLHSESKLLFYKLILNSPREWKNIKYTKIGEINKKKYKSMNKRQLHDKYKYSYNIASRKTDN